MVSGRSVPSRIQIEADAAPSAVRSVCRRELQAQDRRSGTGHDRIGRIAPRGRSAWSAAPDSGRAALAGVAGPRDRYNGCVPAVQVGDITFGGGHRLVLIAGPCVIESAAHAESL